VGLKSDGKGQKEAGHWLQMGFQWADSLWWRRETVWEKLHRLPENWRERERERDWQEGVERRKK